MTPIQVPLEKTTILQAVRNHTVKPLTVMARTFENRYPLSANRLNSMPVTGIAAIPRTSARSHHVQKTSASF